MTRLTVKHRFNASAERVYDAWFDPEKVRRFLFTTATGEIVRCDMDARVGGRYAIVDRRNGEDILHEGTYLELERPRRIVFTLRVPKYSPDEDRVTIEIEPREHGCELLLTTETPDEWADDTKRGWAMILDVLDETLPVEAPTCGAGLAQHAAVPRRIAVYLAELAETLELHRVMLVEGDPASEREGDVYRELSASYRDIAQKLRDTADHMDAQRDLPMGAHDEAQWTDAHTKSFAKFVHEQGALASVLRVAAARDERMLASMQKKTE
ncbi:MAG TPA: SRPBCC family protein [Polyangiaceae bacterium]